MTRDELDGMAAIIANHKRIHECAKALWDAGYRLPAPLSPISEEDDEKE